jgi:murein DD-endopeptidase MepM/ murein hydrolase activator NlpD
MHEGIDIVAAATTPVKAVEDGVIAWVSVPTTPGPHNYLAVNSGNHGWNYYHVLPGTNPNTGKRWEEGDAVKAGEVLGTVEAQAMGSP